MPRFLSIASLWIKNCFLFVSGPFFSFLVTQKQIHIIGFLLYQAFLLKEGFIQMLTRVLGRCFTATDSDGKQVLDTRSSTKCGLLNWCVPVFKCFSLLCSRKSVHHAGKNDS